MRQMIPMRRFFMISALVITVLSSCQPEQPGLGPADTTRFPEQENDKQLAPWISPAEYAEQAQLLDWDGLQLDSQPLWTASIRHSGLLPPVLLESADASYLIIQDASGLVCLDAQQGQILWRKDAAVLQVYQTASQELEMLEYSGYASLIDLRNGQTIARRFAGLQEERQASDWPYGIVYGRYQPLAFEVLPDSVLAYSANAKSNEAERRGDFSTSEAVPMLQPEAGRPILIEINVQQEVNVQAFQLARDGRYELSLPDFESQAVLLELKDANGSILADNQEYGGLQPFLSARIPAEQKHLVVIHLPVSAVQQDDAAMVRVQIQLLSD